MEEGGTKAKKKDDIAVIAASQIDSSMESSGNKRMKFAEGTVFPAPNKIKRVGTSAAFDNDDIVVDEDGGDDEDFLGDGEVEGIDAVGGPLMIEDCPSAAPHTQDEPSDLPDRGPSVQFSSATSSSTVTHVSKIGEVEEVAAAQRPMNGEEDGSMIVRPPQPKAILKKSSYLLPAPGDGDSLGPPPPSRR